MVQLEKEETDNNSPRIVEETIPNDAFELFNLELPFPGTFLPEPIQEIAQHYSRIFKINYETIVTLMIAEMAAAIGGKYRVNPVGKRILSPAFNVISIHQAVERQIPLLDSIRDPLKSRTLELKDRAKWSHTEAGQKWDAQSHEATQILFKKLFATAHKGIEEQIENDKQRWRAEHMPELFSDDMTPETLATSLLRSFDRSVLLEDEAIDPVERLSAMDREQRLKLLRILNAAWDGLPVLLRKQPIQGHVTLSWQIPCTSAITIGGTKDFMLSTKPVPAVYINFVHHDYARENTELLCIINQRWDTFIGTLWDRRLQNVGQSIDHVISNEAWNLWAGFKDRLRKGLPAVERRFRKHLTFLDWLPPRIALLWHILKERKKKELDEEAMAAGVKLSGWIGTLHLRALYSSVSIGGCPSDIGYAEVAEGLSHEAKMLSKIQQKEPVTKAKLRKCYNRPKEVSFDETFQKLLAKEKIRFTDGRHVMTC